MTLDRIGCGESSRGMHINITESTWLGQVGSVLQ